MFSEAGDWWLPSGPTSRSFLPPICFSSGLWSWASCPFLCFCPPSPFLSFFFFSCAFLLFFLPLLHPPPPFRETFSPRVQLQRSYSAWALSITETEKVGYQIHISLHLPLLYARLETLTLFSMAKCWGLCAPFACSSPHGYVCWLYFSSASANMKYSCSLFFLLCIFAYITLEDWDVCGCILAFFLGIDGAQSRRHIRWDGHTCIWDPLAIIRFTVCSIFVSIIVWLLLYSLFRLADLTASHLGPWAFPLIVSSLSLSLPLSRPTFSHLPSFLHLQLSVPQSEGQHWEAVVTRCELGKKRAFPCPCSVCVVSPLNLLPSHVNSVIRVVAELFVFVQTLAKDNINHYQEMTLKYLLCEKEKLSEMCLTSLQMKLFTCTNTIRSHDACQHVLVFKVKNCGSLLCIMSSLLHAHSYKLQQQKDDENMKL